LVANHNPNSPIQSFHEFISVFAKSLISQIRCRAYVHLDDVLVAARRTVDGVVLVVNLDGRRLVDWFQVLLRAVAARGRLDGAVTPAERREREERVDRLDRLLLTTPEHAAATHQTNDEAEDEQRDSQTDSQTNHHVGSCQQIRYDTIDDLHWKTDRQAASLI